MAGNQQFSYPSTQTDALGQFIGTSSSQVNGGTLFSGPVGSDGKSQQRFVPGIQGTTGDGKLSSPVSSPSSGAPGYSSVSQINNLTALPVSSEKGNETTGEPPMTGYSNVGNTTPGTVSSDNYTANKNTAQEDLLRQESQAQRDTASAERDRQIALENADFAMKQQEMQMNQEAQQGAEKATQFRLGLGGTNVATAESARNEVFRTNAIQQLQNAHNDVLARIKNAASQDDWKAVGELRQNLKNIQDEKDKLVQQNFTNTLAMNADVRAGQAADRSKLMDTYNIVKDIPAGQTQTIDGQTFTGIKTPDPFWTSANITSLMEKLPEGETKTVHDPYTGHDITITGMQPDSANNQIFKSVNENTGDETFTTMNKNGKIVNQVVSKGTGAVFKQKTGGGGSSAKQTPEEKAFQDDLGKSIANLSKDPTQWGTEWNYMYSRYHNDLEASAKANGTTVNDVLDKLMNKQMYSPAQQNNGGGSSALSNVLDWGKSFFTNESTPTKK